MISPENTTLYSSPSESKKIAFVSNTSFSLYNFRLGVMKSFVEQGYQVYAVAPHDQYSELFQPESINYVPLHIDGKGTNLFRDINLFFSILKLYRQYRFDFIFHYTIKPVIYGSFAARVLKTPSIAVTTGLGYAFYKNDWLNKVVLFLYRKSLKKVKEVWFLNEDDREVFIRNKVVCRSKTFVLQSEGINTSSFASRKKEKNADKFVFLFLSRLVKEKGIEEYVMAAKKLKEKYPDIECQVLGNTEILNPNNVPLELMKEWDKKGYVRYLGSSVDVRPYIAECDCVVLPSYYREGVPRCLMEGLSMERPIITTSSVGCIELIRDGQNGLLCGMKDVDDLAEKMEKMYLLTNEIRAEWGANGRKMILEKYDENIIIKIYHEKIAQYLQ